METGHLLPLTCYEDYLLFKKLPFRPKEGQLYYTFGFTLNVISIHWAGCKYDMERKMLGIVFRTGQEAIEYLPIYSKRLRGEEE